MSSIQIFSFSLEHLQCFFYFEYNQLFEVSFEQPLHLPVRPFDQTQQQSLDHFLRGVSLEIPFSLKLQGTDFRLRVWRALLSIPYGQTVTYGALAKQLNSSPRAVGQACKANPMPLLIPCHRVVAQQHLGGYAGAVSGSVFEIKPYLLSFEAQNLKKRVEPVVSTTPNDYS